jgi:rhombotail lipoprotein
MKATSVVLACLMLIGCAGLFGAERRQGVSSSLVDYLYPSGEEPPKPAGAAPNLQLPLTVGLAFVPSNSGRGALTEAERMELLNKVKQHFGGRDFIAEIAVIPEAYMKTGRGFEAMEQLARLYALDVIALVSYDQVAHTDERASSFLYWTIVGAYVVEGTKNEVQTLVDTAVFDIPTRTLLFRAPGIDMVTKDATLIGTPEQVRKTQDESFGRAMDQMTANLQKELDVFRQRIQSEGAARVVHAGSAGPGSGSGSVDGLILCALLLLVALGLRRNRVCGSQS